MFIHLSNNESVSEKNIVGIFNLETASMQSDTREFLKQKQKELCDDEYAETVYFTCISAKALTKRGQKAL